MKLLASVAALCAAIVLCAGAPAGVAADACDNGATVDVLPLHGAIGVHHEVDLIVLARFELNRLVPNSLVFHVATPTGTKDLAGGNDTLGTKFTAGSIGGYSAYATWKLYGCSDRGAVSEERSAPIAFKVFHERRPGARFKATIVPGRTSSRAPIVAVDAVCPPSTIGVTDPLVLSVFWELGRKTPSHRSPHSNVVLREGCAGRAGPDPKTKSYSWGVVRGATIGVLPGHTVRVLAEVKSGKTIVGQTRMRFEPRGNREALLRDRGHCIRGCVKRIFKY